nr:hypothetical protein [Tanacetum cinerariifolium]
MAEMFGLLTELTTSRTLEKVLVREEASNPITKYVNAISLVKMKKDKSIGNNEVVDKNVVESSELNAMKPTELVDKKKETEDGTDDETVRSMKEELIRWETKADVLVEMPSIGRLKYVNALIDQGSNVKIIPISIYNRLTIEKSVGTNIRLSLASHTYIYPLGIAEDVLINIAGYVYLVDFVILDIEENKNKPFILGMPFLTMAKAEIRFDKGSITLRSGKNKINFFKIYESPCKIKKKPKEDISYNPNKYRE